MVTGAPVNIRLYFAKTRNFKMFLVLDAVGDLALAGAPLLAAFKSVRGGHRLNSLVVKALLADKTAWTMVNTSSARDAIHADADLPLGFAVANYAADRS